ncbi:MAG: hypothetical protein IKK20_01740 [Clostridia bacterium]|nr:hypothetical protein [Clostridia bacterium]MBR3790508.1 hypothetical protein [Clostridia bacterium]
MTLIDKSTIQGFAKIAEEKAVLPALDGAAALIQNALEDISRTNPYVSPNFSIFPVGEFFSGAVSPTSTIDLLLVVNNPQIILNTQNLFKSKWHIFWNRLKFAWKNRKKHKKRKKRRDKKQKIAEEPFADPKNKYDISSLSRDLVKAIAKQITQEDIVQLSRGTLLVQGASIPYNIRIFPVLEKDEKFLFYRPGIKKLYSFEIETYQKNIQAFLNQGYAQEFLQQVQIFDGLYHHLMEHAPKSSYIESLVANLPHAAFQNDVYENFVFAVNYLTNTKLGNLFSIYNPQKKIFEDEICGVSAMEINNFFKKLCINLTLE